MCKFIYPGSWFKQFKPWASFNYIFNTYRYMSVLSQPLHFIQLTNVGENTVLLIIFHVRYNTMAPILDILHSILHVTMTQTWNITVDPLHLCSSHGISLNTFMLIPWCRPIYYVIFFRTFKLLFSISILSLYVICLHNFHQGWYSYIDRFCIYIFFELHLNYKRVKYLRDRLKFQRSICVLMQ